MRGEMLFWIGHSGVASAEITSESRISLRAARREVSREGGVLGKGEEALPPQTSPRWPSPESDRGCRPLFLWTREHSSWGLGWVWSKMQSVS